MKVYLAGPISGLSYEGCTDWRDDVRVDLAAAGIIAYSPMRSKAYLKGIESLEPDCEPYAVQSTLSSNRGITTRDRWDATRCDLLFVNLLGATTPSIGTIAEMAWADLGRIPIVCAIEASGNPHEHGMLKEMIGFRVSSLRQAVAITKAVLLPDFTGDLR